MFNFLIFLVLEFQFLAPTPMLNNANIPAKNEKKPYLILRVIVHFMHGVANMTHSVADITHGAANITHDSWHGLTHVAANLTQGATNMTHCVANRTHGSTDTMHYQHDQGGTSVMGVTDFWQNQRLI